MDCSIYFIVSRHRPGTWQGGLVPRMFNLTLPAWQDPRSEGSKAGAATQSILWQSSTHAGESEPADLDELTVPAGVAKANFGAEDRPIDRHILWCNASPPGEY